MTDNKEGHRQANILYLLALSNQGHSRAFQSGAISLLKDPTVVGREGNKVEGNYTALYNSICLASTLRDIQKEDMSQTRERQAAVANSSHPPFPNPKEAAGEFLLYFKNK